MTSRALGILLLTGAAVAFGEFSDWPLMNQVAMILATVIIIAFLWSKQAIRGLSLTRTASSDRVQVGQVLSESMAVTNAGRLGKLWLEIRDRSSLPGHNASRIVSLRGRDTEEWTTQSFCVKRGIFDLGPVTLRTGDPFGLFTSRREMLDRVPITVYPPVFQLPSLRFPTASVSGGARLDKRSLFMTPAVSTVRDYVAGDPYNRISWSSSAKLGRLMVKEFDLDPTAEVWIVLDMDRSGFVPATQAAIQSRDPDLPFEDAWLESTDDYAAAIGASVARHALAANRAIGLISSDSTKALLQAERSERQYLKLLELMAVIQANGSTSLEEVLLTEARRFDRIRSPIVITTTTNHAAFDVLDTYAIRGVKPVVIYIDPSTFDPSRAPAPFLDSFPERRYPIHRVDYRQGISNSFLEGLPWAA